VSSDARLHVSGSVSTMASLGAKKDQLAQGTESNVDGVKTVDGENAEDCIENFRVEGMKAMRRQVAAKYGGV
jgi:hypothetical protein